MLLSRKGVSLMFYIYLIIGIIMAGLLISWVIGAIPK